MMLAWSWKDGLRLLNVVNRSRLNFGICVYYDYRAQADRSSWKYTHTDLTDDEKEMGGRWVSSEAQ
jgi:hypothetical protein